MAENATPSKIEATRAYGAEVVLHGTLWDEANEKAKQLVEECGDTYIHPFDDEEVIQGQGTVGLESFQHWPVVELAIVPIGGGGLIWGVANGRAGDLSGLAGEGACDRADRRRRADFGGRAADEGLKSRDSGCRRRVVGRAGDDAKCERRASCDARRRGLHNRRLARKAR